MKRMIVTAATILAASTPAFTQNTEQENNAAMAAVTYMIAQKRCNLTTGEDGKLRVTANSVIESHGFSWEKVVYGEKPMIGKRFNDHTGRPDRLNEWSRSSREARSVLVGPGPRQ